MIIYDQGNYRPSFTDYFEHFMAALLLFHTLAPCGSSVPSNNTAFKVIIAVHITLTGDVTKNTCTPTHLCNHPISQPYAQNHTHGIRLWFSKVINCESPLKLTSFMSEFATIILIL